jgi:hypothetical protein
VADDDNVGESGDPNEGRRRIRVKAPFDLGIIAAVIRLAAALEAGSVATHRPTARRT